MKPYQRKSLVVLATLILIGLSCMAHATVVSLSGKSVCIDNTMYSTKTADNSGLGNPNRAGRNNMSNNFRLLIQYDLSTIPANATINSVSLQMTVTNVPIGATLTSQSLYRLTNTWSEGTGVGSGSGGQVVPGGSSWVFTYYPTTTWNSAGGDFIATASATTTIGTVNPSTTIWTGSGLVADVQGWVNDSTTNHGWILIGDETTSQSIRGYASAEDGTSPPVLIVNYTPATPVELSEFYMESVH